jgi:hypothetical protein
MMVAMRTAAVIVIVALTHAAWAQPSQPQPPDAPTPLPSPAQALFEEGRALLDAGQPGPACEKFEAALKLDPEGLGTILNLGLCTEQLDKLATALTWFRRVQSRASELGKPDTEAAAKDKTTALAPKVPTIKIAFTHPPPDGTVATLDGAHVADVDLSRIEVDAGKHVVDVTVPKASPVHEELTLVDGDAKTVTVQITPPTPVKQFVMVDRGARERRRAYILGGVGGGLLISDLALGLVAHHYYNATDELDTRDQWRNVVRYGGTTLFLAGGAAITVAVMLYVRAPGMEKVEISPTGRDGVSVSFRGTF